MRESRPGRGLADLSIRNPVFAVMLAAAMLVFGYLGYRDMGVSQFPEVDFPVVSVIIALEGASPDVMDGDVTDVVEDAVAGVEGVDYVASQSYQGVSQVNVFFRLDRDIDVAMQDVQNVVSAARRKLPREIEQPVILKLNPNNLPVLWITLSSSSVPHGKICDFAEKEFKQAIAAIQDVGGVQFSGLRARNVRIWLDTRKMWSYNLTAAEIRTAIQQQHQELPAGTITSRMIEANVRAMGEAYSIDEFKRILIARRNDQAIYLGDLVASIEDGTEDERSVARYNGRPAVAVGVRKAIGGNLVAVCENVKAEMPKLKRMLPAGVEMHVPIDYSVFVRENVEEMKLTLILGVLLTALVCFLFLGSLGTTVNVCLSIPTSLVGTFFIVNFGMKLFGRPPFTINLMTLLALSLSVGVVVDDAILVLENIYRRREQGLSRLRAALLGAREISFAAVAATLSIVAIFLPVAFLSGTVGRFFFQFGVTVGVAVLLSLVSALTLTPMLCSLFLDVKHGFCVSIPRRRKWTLGLVGGLFLIAVAFAAKLVLEQLPQLRKDYSPLASAFSVLGSEYALPAAFVIGFLLTTRGHQVYAILDKFFLTPVLVYPVDRFMRLVTAAYLRVLRFSLRVPALVLLVGAAIGGVAVWMLAAGVLGKELIPSEDQSRFVVHVVCPVDSNIEQVKGLLRECEETLLVRDDVAGVLTAAGSESGTLIFEADIFVNLVPKDQREQSQQEIMSEIRSQLQGLGDVRVVMRDLSQEGFTAQRGDPIDFALKGDWKELPHLANTMMEEMRASGLVADVDCNYRPGKTEQRVIPNRVKLGRLNAPVGRVAESLSLMVGGQKIAKYTDNGRRYDVRIKLAAGQRDVPADLDSVPVRVGVDRLVPLRDVVDLQPQATLPVLNRFKHQRSIEITATPAAGVSQGEAVAGCQEIAKRVLPNEDYEAVELGNASAMKETISGLVFALALGILVVYGILAVQFASFVHPFTVLLALPFAATGALVTLYLTGDTLNMMSLIGMILLMGLVKKNSIILVDAANRQRATGLAPIDAVIHAGRERLRPILMTSLACVAGAIPAAIGLGPGAETRAPMARGIIGGIVLSTLVTLVMVPVFYVLVERFRGLFTVKEDEPHEKPPAHVPSLNGTTPQVEKPVIVG
ncbi:efflux RND transporter permease subunit [Limnoglobus roseus]|uniref:AcrB/AcrD/AcrF family protein n=1 Tax=Limnoglobus roseus TaxID=2598579 RepID=A0A5C1AB99_9BACT|nr:efflux RND transporter permease subunit [Limnoglobus roseus]QEL15855.1 AcrB/AcrD/AcrF family protein [Limnoglobus roseus]